MTKTTIRYGMEVPNIFRNVLFIAILTIPLQTNCVSACTDGSLTSNPDDPTCSTYLQCDHGNAIVRQCPSGLLFNPKISNCDWPQNVDCGGGGVSTTTTTTSSPPSSSQQPSTEGTTTSGPGPTPPPGPISSSIRFAPYFDVNMNGPKMTDIFAKAGQRDFMLAFAIGSSESCVPKWGGQIDIDSPTVLQPIRDLQANGGKFVVSTGGAMGPYLEQQCSTSEALAQAYKQVLDTVKTNHLDIDIESTVNADLVNGALALVQRERPETTVSFTLMVQAEDYGLTPQLGVEILQNAKKNGVRVDSVNPMTMEFGGPSPDFGDSVIGAATSVFQQMKQIWPEKGDQELWGMLSVTPMIGRNFNGKIFTQDHARKLVNWARQKGVGRLHFWSAGRDNGNCAGGGVSPSCSSIQQTEYEFTKIFQGFQ